MIPALSKQRMSEPTCWEGLQRLLGRAAADVSSLLENEQRWKTCAVSLGKLAGASLPPLCGEGFAVHFAEAFFKAARRGVAPLALHLLSAAFFPSCFAPHRWPSRAFEAPGKNQLICCAGTASCDLDKPDQRRIGVLKRGDQNMVMLPLFWGPIAKKRASRRLNRPTETARGLLF